MIRNLRIPVVVAMLSLVAAVPARADTWSVLKDSSTHDSRPHTLDAELILGYLFGSYNHIGLGGWYGYPVMPDGFIPKINDAFYVEAGASVERFSWDYGIIGYNCSQSWWRITPAGGVRWQFNLTQDWSAFATAKLGFGIGFADSYDCGGITGSSGGADLSKFVFDTGLGAYWNFADNWRMRFDFGYYSSLAVGAGTDIMQ